MSGLVWRNVIRQHKDEWTFECPITGGGINVMEYHEVYGPFLETLDGRDLSSYVDFFFERSPLNRFHWAFVDEDAKADFVDFCLEMKAIPELELIRSGDHWLKKMDQQEEERVEKIEKEKQKADQKRKQQEKQKAKKKMTPEEKKEMIRQQCQASLTKLESELETELAKSESSSVLSSDGEKVKKLQEKILKVKNQLEKMT